MNLDIFKIEDKSGKFSKEKYLINNHPKEHDNIISWCFKNNITDIPFKEKVYLFKTNSIDKPICRNPDCYKPTKFINNSLGFREYCSNKCVSSDPNIKKTKEEKSFKKFGTKTPAESNIIKEKIKKTNQERYGFNSSMCLEETQEKSKKTLFKNHGVDNPSKSKEILNKRVESFKLNIDQYKESYRKTSIDRYGVDHPWSNPDIHKKTIDFFYKSYKERIINNIKDGSVKFIDFKKGDKTKLVFKCLECNKEFEILTYQFYWRVNNINKICTKCHPISETSSFLEKELLNFIKENYKGEIVSNTNNIIKPYEIDVYLPDLKIGFEFNGVFWHSEKFKNNSYHLDKLNKSNESSIRLITIWEDDWNIKNDICKSFIMNILSKSEKIWARKCQIKEVNYNESKLFLDNNHLQGDCKSSVRLGLYYNNILVSIMTFSKLRLPVGGKNKIGTWELTRFCNRTGKSVIGGASKLLKHFIKSKKPIEIQSYSDNMISNGDLYEKLGFKYSHTSKPGYWYVVNGIRQHRFNWRKDKLVKAGADPNKYEHEIMEEMGYWRIFNGGNKKWILNPN